MGIRVWGQGAGDVQPWDGALSPLPSLATVQVTGMSVSDVLENYPNVQVEDVKAALEYGGVVSGE